MHLPLVVPIALFLPLASAYTYWIDPVSCTSDKLRPQPGFGDKPDERDRWASLITEIKDLGSNGLGRLDKQSDNPDFRRAWNWIFGPTDNSYDRTQPIRLEGPTANVKSYLEFIQGLGLAVAQTQANIRICESSSLWYLFHRFNTELLNKDCDNDSRWVKKQDGKGWKGMAAPLVEAEMRIAD
jgi:hypothetical protein